MEKSEIESESVKYMEHFRRIDRQNEYLHPWVAAKVGWTDGFLARDKLAQQEVEELKAALNMVKRKWKPRELRGRN